MHPPNHIHAKLYIPSVLFFTHSISTISLLLLHAFVTLGSKFNNTEMACVELGSAKSEDGCSSLCDA